MKNREQYIESLRMIKPVVYYMGEKVESVVDHPALRPHVNCAALTYELACQPEHQDLLTAWSPFLQARVNRWTHIHENTSDLVKKVKALRLLGQKTGACFQRCVGWDALNAVYSVTWEIDQKNKTCYHARFLKFLERVQRDDLMLAGAMTDTKGDRSKKPGQQQDPDMYVHVVERKPDGIVVRGAKAHMTGMVNSHEMLVMPTLGMGEGEEDYSVCFSLPVDAPGVIHIFGRQTNDTRRLEDSTIDTGNHQFGIVGGEALTIFDDVFVPWDNVFLCGETEYSGLLVERFATLHRQNYGGCKTGVSDVIIGAAASLADYNGVESASHVRDKLVEMTLLAETLYGCSLACSNEGRATPSGAYVADPMLANITKQNVTRNIYEICRLAQDIAGGLMATLPSEADINNPEIGPFITKYLKGREGVNTEARIRMMRLIENLTGGTALVESMHGAGSPQAQKIMIYRNSSIKGKKRLAEILAGVEPETGDSARNSG